MSPESDEIILLFALYVFLWASLTLYWCCWRLFHDRFQNQGSDNTESAGTVDVEQGETIDSISTHWIDVIPAVRETRWPMSGPKALVSSADHECAICLECFEEKEICLVLLNCGHVFHKPCVEEWLKIDWSCPLCRTNTCSITITIDA
ncbi:hypothetical protein PTKIN_Ptkin14bG0131200 [Pterospermum kingtungense]